MNLSTKSILFGLTTTLLLSSLALADGGKPRTGNDGIGRGRHARFERRQHVRQFVRSLEFTDAQRANALAAAKTIAPIAEAARAEGRKLIEDARKNNQTGDRTAIRAAVKAQIEALRERTLKQIEPIGRGLLQSLTPDQRAKIQAALEKHGKTYDEERAARRISLMLARPRAVQFLEARTQH